jgi:hypothetical protein
MVLPDSHRVARVLRYLGTASRGRAVSPTGLSPSVVVRSRSLRLPLSLLTLWLTPEAGPQPPPCCQRRFRLLPVRSPLLGESLLISVPGGTEMFHFPPFASRPCGRDDWALPQPGFPIRAPPSHSLLSGSSRFFAARHALRRMSAPRHPPHALSSLPTLTVELPLAYTRLLLSPSNIMSKSFFLFLTPFGIAAERSKRGEGDA